MKAVVDKS